MFRGGVLGNRGGTGRPRSEVRLAALEGAAKAVPRLRRILTNPKSSPRDVIAASRVLLEFGVGRQVEIEETTPSARPTSEEMTRRLAQGMPALVRSAAFSVPELLAVRDALDQTLRIRAIMEEPEGSVALARSSELEVDPTPTA